MVALGYDWSSKKKGLKFSRPDAARTDHLAKHDVWIWKEMCMRKAIGGSRRGDAVGERWQ